MSHCLPYLSLMVTLISLRFLVDFRPVCALLYTKKGIRFICVAAWTNPLDIVLLLQNVIWRT